MAYTNEQFFNKLKNGAKWDVGVSIARGNPLPLDANSVFESLTKAEEYVAGVLAYPGQIIAVLSEGAATAYLIVSNAEGVLSLQEVGKATLGDNKSITLDPTTGVLSLFDFGKKYMKLVKDEDNGTTSYVETEGWITGLEPKVVDDKLVWFEPNPSTVEGLQSSVTTLSTNVNVLNQEMDAVEGRAKALEDKINGMGSILNFAGSCTSEDITTGKIKIDDYDIGDVILVDGTKEYVCIERDVEVKDDEGNPTGETRKEKFWEPIGDAQGVEILTSKVSTLESEMDEVESRATTLETWVTNSQDAINAVANKADKVTGATSGNFAGLDANGNLTDSGKKATDFEVAGAAAAVLGQSTDGASANTVYGAKAAATAAATAAKNAQDTANASATQLEGMDATAGSVKSAIEAAATKGQQGIDNASAQKERIDNILNGSTIKTFAEVDAFKTAQATTDKNQTDAITALQNAVGSVVEGTNLASLVSAAQKQADKGVADAAAAQKTANDNATVIGSHTTKIGTIEGQIVTLNTAVTTAQSTADEGKTLAGKNSAKLAGINDGDTVVSHINAAKNAVIGDATTAVAGDATVQGALKAAAVAQKKADDNADSIIAINTSITSINDAFGDTYSKTKTIKSAIDAAKSGAEATAAAALAPVSAKADANAEKLVGIGGTDEPATVVAAINSAKIALETADKNLSDRIDGLAQAVGSVTGVMHFIGVSTTDPTEIVTINGSDYKGEIGDVVLYQDKEYVCTVAGTEAEGVVLSSGTWIELGDVSAEGQRIKALEDIIGKPASGTEGQEDYVEATGLQKIIANNGKNIATNANNIIALQTTLGGENSGLIQQVNTLDATINAETTGILARLASAESVIGEPAIGEPDEEGYVEATGLQKIIADHTSAIATNTANIATNAGNITVLQTSLSNNYYTKAEVDEKLTWTKFQ